MEGLEKGCPPACPAGFVSYLLFLTLSSVGWGAGSGHMEFRDCVFGGVRAWLWGCACECVSGWCWVVSEVADANWWLDCSQTLSGSGRSELGVGAVGEFSGGPWGLGLDRSQA